MLNSFVPYSAHQHKRWGGLVRVLDGFYNSRPSYEDLEELVRHLHRFVTFFPVKAAVSRGIFKVVTNCLIPEFAQKFPIFKSGTPDPKTRKVKTWWLWDGEKSWKIGELSDKEQKKYPKLGIFNDTGLIHAIETGISAQGIDLC